MATKTKAEIKLESVQKKAAKKLATQERIFARKLASSLNKVTKLKAKDNKKTKKQLKKILWDLVAIPIRSKNFKCYTCDRPLDFKDRSTGHLFTKGGHPATIFDPDNLRVQCTACNVWKSGNCAVYSYRLIQEIGLERYNALALRAGQAKKWTREELERIIKEFELSS